MSGCIAAACAVRKQTFAAGHIDHMLANAAALGYNKLCAYGIAYTHAEFLHTLCQLITVQLTTVHACPVRC